jgi:hypothetical protein
MLKRLSLAGPSAECDCGTIFGPRALAARARHVAENTDERASDGTGTKPPRRSVDEAQPGCNGGVFIEGTGKWLTFDMSGRRKHAKRVFGCPLDGGVRSGGQGQLTRDLGCAATPTT